MWCVVVIFRFVYNIFNMVSSKNYKKYNIRKIKIKIKIQCYVYWIIKKIYQKNKKIYEI